MRLTTLPPSCAVMKSGNLNFLEHSGPLQACNGTACLLLYLNVCLLLVGNLENVTWSSDNEMGVENGTWSFDNEMGVENGTWSSDNEIGVENGTWSSDNEMDGWMDGI